MYKSIQKAFKVFSAVTHLAKHKAVKTSMLVAAHTRAWAQLKEPPVNDPHRPS